jgi:polyketide cyclase/dehydrase/lipid transport protein
VARIRLERRVDVGAAATVVWDHVTDWPRQAEWVPMTRVERVDAADGLGGRLRAWTGVGPVGFWDPMTITVWQRDADGGGRCEVLHRGRVVRGEGEFSVLARERSASTFVWAEVLVVPGGRLGALAFRLARPLLERALDGALQRMRRRVESSPPS